MNVARIQFLRAPLITALQKCGVKNYPPPPDYKNIEFPSRPKLRYMDKVPVLPPSIKPPKMQKRLRLMRGPELVHNFLQHKQYGIIAQGGGRMHFGHFEMVRMTIAKKIDPSRMFAVWRIDSPWQPVTRKGQGQRMGGGKGAIDHYVTPVKSGRVIIELGGKCEWAEVERFLQDIANKLPFKATAVSQRMLDEAKEREKWEEENNQNVYTLKYLIQNNMQGCWKWLSPTDKKYCGKYV